MKAVLVSIPTLINYEEAFGPAWTPQNGVADSASLVEAAGRACYQSWHRPSAATADNRDYIANIIDQGHFSVLEHANFGFYITGVSRSLTHELVRHRHFSFSELSQRFVNVENVEMVKPPAVDQQTWDDLDFWWEGLWKIRKGYHDIVERLVSRGHGRKQAREAARAVMPNATETKIVVTGNARAWRHFINVRGSEHADAEIRELALSIAWNLVRHDRNLFDDVEFYNSADGRACVRTRVREIS